MWTLGQTASAQHRSSALVGVTLHSHFEHLNTEKKPFFILQKPNHLSLNSSLFAPEVPSSGGLLARTRVFGPRLSHPLDGQLFTDTFSKCTDVSFNHEIPAEFLPLSSGKNSPEVPSAPKHFPGMAAKRVREPLGRLGL